MCKTLFIPILDDEGLTRGLADPEARMLIDWLVDRAERIHEQHPSTAPKEVVSLCRRARSITRFVSLWSEDKRSAACQLAATEQFAWPLPAGPVDPCDLMESILSWETDRLDHR